MTSNAVNVNLRGFVVASRAMARQATQTLANEPARARRPGLFKGR
jgi:hypothetical protein